MKEKILFSIGIKLLGLYLLITGISSVPQILLALEMEAPSNIKNVQVFAMFWYLGINIVLGALLVFKGDLIAYLLRSRSAESINELNISVSEILQLIGIFLIVSSIGPLIKGVIPLLPVGEVMVFELGELLSPAITFVLGVLLSARPGIVDSLFTPHSNA